MSDTVIRVEKLSKRYVLGGRPSGTARYDTFRDALVRTVKRPLARLRPPLPGSRSSIRDAEFWALRDVSFEVRRGEILGIIGRNGAGKSTLLKILSRITEPTAGRVALKGRVASLLEVGTGFHPELSGRENIFLNGVILGMTRAEVKGRFDEIVDFAEVARFLDTPVKHYSSGMYVRLAFAVAAHLDPEILIVDEVLAVGDAQFQKKCLGKISQLAGGDGRTVLLVSHNMIAVQSLCSHGVYLEDGKVRSVGAAGPVVAAYRQGDCGIHSARHWPDAENAPGNEDIRLRSMDVRAAIPDEGVITMETAVKVDLGYCRQTEGKRLHLMLHLVNEDEVVVLTTTPGCCAPESGFYRSECTLPGRLLNSGGYRFRLLIVEDGSRVVWTNESIFAFAVIDARERVDGWMGREPSAVQIPLEWRSSRG